MSGTSHISEFKVCCKNRKYNNNFKGLVLLMPRSWDTTAIIRGFHVTYSTEGNQHKTNFDEKLHTNPNVYS